MCLNSLFLRLFPESVKEEKEIKNEAFLFHWGIINEC